MKREKLLILNEILSDIQIDKFNDYITNLNQDELKYISANKIAKKLNISLDIAENILEKCEYNKITVL